MHHVASWFAASLLFAGTACADPVGSAITYQGQLTDAGAPASGTYDFQFALFNSASGGPVIDTLAVNDLAVSGGLVNASLDFTEVPYDGQALWVEVRVRPGASSGGYTTLLPRQTLNAAPYALHALSGNPGPQGPPGVEGPPGIQGPPGALALPFAGSNAATFSVSITNTSPGGTALSGTTNAASGAGAGVQGFASNTDGVGVRGVNSAGPGVNGRSTGSPGVVGESTNSRGVFGYTANGVAGVYGQSISGDGVVAISTQRHGLYGESSAPGFAAVAGVNVNGIGVRGRSTNSPGVEGTSENGSGVAGLSEAGNGVSGYSDLQNGVRGESTARNGVLGESESANYGAVEGINRGTTAPAVGVAGRCFAVNCWAMYAYGSLGVTGTKSFVEPHPTDPGKEIRYVSLEGRESGTYFRGTGRLVNGRATVAVPEDFAMVTSEEGLTVQLTAIGQPAILYLVTTNLRNIDVAGSADVEFNYLVHGVRKAFADHQPIAANVSFVPRTAADARNLAASLPAESVRRMIANGSLNADGSVNAETAHRLGWDQRAGWSDPPRAPEGD